jgi:hypothetical protein
MLCVLIQILNISNKSDKSHPQTVISIFKETQPRSTTPSATCPVWEIPNSRVEAQGVLAYTGIIFKKGTYPRIKRVSRVAGNSKGATRLSLIYLSMVVLIADGSLYQGYTRHPAGTHFISAHEH